MSKQFSPPPIRINTASKSIFDERKASFLRLLHSCIERIASDSSVRDAARGMQDIEAVIATVERTISRYVRSEQEVFLSYLMCLIQQSNVKGLPMPRFYDQIQSKIVLLNDKYDRAGELKRLLDSFRGRPQENLDFGVFISNIAGFFYEAGTVHSFMMNAKKLVSEFVRVQTEELKKARTQSVEYMRAAAAKLVDHSSKVDDMRMILNETKAKQREEVGKLTYELERAQQVNRNYEKFRLEVEGYVIRLMQQLALVKTESVTEPGMAVTLEELKKQTKDLRKFIKETTSNTFPESRETPRIVQKQGAERQIKEKDEIIQQLRQEIELLKKNQRQPEVRSEQTKTPQIVNPIKNQPLIQDTVAKEELMTEVIQKTDKLRDYYVIKNELDDLRQEVHALRQQKVQADEYAEMMNKENIKLKGTVEALKAQLSAGTIGFDTLYEQMEKLQNHAVNQKLKLKAAREKNEELKAELENAKKVISAQDEKVKELSVDYGAFSMRGDILMEQITNLKTEVAVKENDCYEMKKELHAKNQELEIHAENEKAKAAEIETLKLQIKKLTVRKQRREDRILQMQKVIDQSALQIQEKETVIATQEVKISEQKARLDALEQKQEKTSDAAREMKQKIKEQDKKIADMHFSLKEAQKANKKKDEAMEELKQSAQTLINAAQERDDMKTKLLQAKMEVANTKQKMGIIEQNLKDQTDLSEKLKSEVTEARRKVADIQRQIDSVQFESEALVSKAENEKKGLELEKERLEQQVDMIDNERRKAEKKAQDETEEKKKLIVQHEARIAEINLATKKQIQAIRDTHEIQKGEYDENMRRAQLKLQESNSQVARLTRELSEEKSKHAKTESEFRIYQDDLRQLVHAEDVASKIKDLKHNLDMAETTIDTMNTEIKRSQTQNKQIISELLKGTEVALGTSGSPVTVITTALEAASRKIQGLNDKSRIEREKQHALLSQINRTVKVGNIQEVPAILANLRQKCEAQEQENSEMKVYYTSLFRKVSEIASAETEDGLPNAVAQLKKEKDDLAQKVIEMQHQHEVFVDSFHDFVQFQDEHDLLYAVEKMEKEEMEKVVMIEQLTEKYKEVINEKQALQETLSFIENGVAQSASVDSIDKIPVLVSDLKAKIKSEKEERKSAVAKHNAFVDKLKSTLSAANEQEVPAKVDQLLETLSTTRSNLKEKTVQLKSAKNDVEELSQSYHGLLSSLQKVIKFSSPNQVSTIVGKLVDEKNEREAELHSALETHEKFVSQLKAVVSFQTEEQLPAKLNQMIQVHMEKANDLKELTERHTSLVSGLVVALNCRNEKQIQDSVAQLISKQKQTQEELEHERENHLSLMRLLRKEVTFTDETSLPQKINALVAENEKLTKELASTTKQMNDTQGNHDKLTSTIGRIIGSKQPENIVQEISSLVEAKERLEQSDTQYRTIMNQLHTLLDFKDDARLPTLLEIRLQETKATTKELQDRVEIAETILSKVKAAVPNAKLNELPDAVQAIVTKAEETSIELKSLKKDHDKVMKSVMSITKQGKQAGVASIVSELTQRTRELEDIKEEHENMIASLQKTTYCFDNKEIPRKVQSIVDELDHLKKELEERNLVHSTLIHDLRNSVSFKDESDAASAVSKLSDNFANLQAKNEQNEKVLASVGKTLGVSIFGDLPKVVEKLRAESDQMKGVIDTISSVTEESDMRKLADAVRTLKSDLANAKREVTSASELMSEILSRMLKKQATITFPMETTLRNKIVKTFAEYADKKEEMQSDFDTLMSNARSLGFQGHSCVEASDFLADELCKKKAHEQLEQMVAQMKQLREDKERERAVLEKRNRSTLDKLKEVRRSKAELIEQSAEKQTELFDTIDGLRKDIRDLETKVERVTRIKEELIRLCSHEVYDKDALKNWLTPAEIAKLKL